MTPAIPADENYSLIDTLQRRSLIAGAIGLLICVIGAVRDPSQFFRSYLFAFLFWSGMSCGALGILLLHHVVGGRWGVVIRRLLEAAVRIFPVVAILFLPILFGLQTLYPWAVPEIVKADANIQHKAAYLNVPFFIARAVFYFAIFTAFGFVLNRWSMQQDRTADPKLVDRMRSFSAPALLVFVFTGTFAFIDWIMSLDPHWFSTIYGVMFLVGQVLETFALVIAAVVVLSRRKPLADVMTKQHFHDLGNLLFAFTILWAYLSFSQFLIIWAGNLPEEIPWYLKRLSGGWGWIAVSLVVFHFALPFLLLLQTGVKKRADLLMKVCLWMIFIRLVDVYWVVEPSLNPKGFIFHWMDLATPVGVGGIWLGAFFWQLKNRPLVPINDPRLYEIPKATVTQ